MRDNRPAARGLLWACLFAVSFAFVESAVVVYLRALYYPAGFTFPLRTLPTDHIVVELLREFSTLVMMGSVAFLASTRAWERFGYFLFIFGVWDIFYYVWLKVFLNWPASLLDWDILFLIPLPWIGPVIAPVLIALAMAVAGILFVLRSLRGMVMRLTAAAVVLWMCGTAVILYSFIADTGATLRGLMPEPYRYELLAVGLVLYAAAFAAIKTMSPPDETT